MKTSFKEFLKEYKEKEKSKELKSLNEMENYMSELKPIVDEYYSVLYKYNVKKKQFDQQKQYEDLINIQRETDYVSCTYPSIGEESKTGSVCFKDKDQADKLINSLRNNASYYSSYILEWSGSGIYLIHPEWRYDHDGEIIYTARIKKGDH